MKLTYVSITNYRSITNAYKIDLSNLTVLIGKNNEGKTNVLKAIELGMNILENIEVLLLRKIMPKQFYDWREDFPLSYQSSKKLKDKSTTIRMDFHMDDGETRELNDKIGSSINGELSIYIKITDRNRLSITVPKRGKNAKALSNKIVQICELICEKFNLVYIPAIRSESDAFSVISDLVYSEFANIEDKKYKESLDYINQMQQERLNILSDRMEKPLEKFLPQIKSMNLYLTDRYRRTNTLPRKSINIDIDDGVLTSLSNKGDGVKSLSVIAMLSQITKENDRLIIIDEPENHLHPDAVRYICTVLNELAIENQVLISTHNPIFVNRNRIKSNWIVDSGKARKANRIDEIRNTLGVITSDNLMYSDYVIVVEGPTDRTFFEKYLKEDNIINNCMVNNALSIRSIGGTNNLKSEIYALQRYCCNYLIILDYDSAGKNVINEIKQALSVPDDKIRYFMENKRSEFELEDIYNPCVYKDYLLEKGFDITNPRFKNKSKKWSSRLEDIGNSMGRFLTDDEENQFKKDIVNMLGEPMKEYVTIQGYELINALRQKILQDLKGMNLV